MVYFLPIRQPDKWWDDKHFVKDVVLRGLYFDIDLFDMCWRGMFNLYYHGLW